jgi:hypothetical protein
MQVIQILPASASANNSLFVISCHNFYESANLEKLIENYILHFFNIRYYDGL